LISTLSWQTQDPGFQEFLEEVLERRIEIRRNSLFALLIAVALVPRHVFSAIINHEGLFVLGR